MCKEITTNDSEMTENVTDGWHRGRTELFLASEDKDHITFHNDHFTQRIESTDSEITSFIAAETAEVTDDEHFERNVMNDDTDNEETTNETDERHRGHPVLRTVNEDEDLIAIHNDHVEHDNDDDMDENKIIKRNQEKAKHIHGIHVEIRRVIARESNDEHSDRITGKIESTSYQGWRSSCTISPLGRWDRLYRVKLQ